MTKKWLHRFAFLGLFCTSALAFAQPSTQEISQMVDKALQKSNQPVFTGIIVQSMRSGKVLYQRHGDYHFLPASALKLFTAVAALEYLKPNFRYDTKLLTDNAQVKQHTLKGNVWFHFSGDPTLKRRDLHRMIHSLKRKGINRIQGHVYVDVSAFDNVPYPPGWIWDDLSYAYAAPTSALVLNKNKFILALTPNKKAGGAVTLSTYHMPSHFAQFNNQLTSTSNTKDCPVAIYSQGHNRYTLRGCVQQKAKRQNRLLAITDPVLFGRQWIKHELKKAGIRYPDTITEKRAPKQTALLRLHRSKPLDALATTMLKKSDNLIADAFLKTLGEHYYKTAGTWQNGVKAEKKILAPLTGINFKHTLITDGAGLSRYNLITPMQLAKLLNFAYHDLQIEPELLAAMPIAGKDGTLQYRMRELKPPRNVRGKTGSMNGVSSLAGYLTTTHKDVLSYVILMNNFVGKVKYFRKIEDQICLALTGQKRLKG